MCEGSGASVICLRSFGFGPCCLDVPPLFWHVFPAVWCGGFKISCKPWCQCCTTSQHLSLQLHLSSSDSECFRHVSSNPSGSSPCTGESAHCHRSQELHLRVLMVTCLDGSDCRWVYEASNSSWIPQRSTTPQNRCISLFKRKPLFGGLAMWYLHQLLRFWNKPHKYVHPSVKIPSHRQKR